MITRPSQDSKMSMAESDSSAGSKKRVLSESMLSPQLKNSVYTAFEDNHTVQDNQVTPKHHSVSSSQGSQGLRRSVGLLNLTIDSSPNPKSFSSPKFALLKKKVSDQEMEETNMDVENWSPFREPATPTIPKNQLKRPASNSSTSLSPFISDSQKPLLFSSTKNITSLETNRTSIQMKLNKLRKMVSLDKVNTDSGGIHPLPNPSMHFPNNKENILDSPTNSPSRPARQKLKLDKTTTKNLSGPKPSENDKEGDFITPNSYKFVKPLQTAFMSSGLLSKKNRAPLESFHPPETPCKKPIQLNLPASQKQTFPSSNLANVITASSPINDNSTPKHHDDESMHDSTYEHSPSHSGANLPRSARALNTSGLRDCIWKFSTDFDDSIESIFEENSHDEYDPATPTRLRDAKRVLMKNLKLNTYEFNNDDESSTPRTPNDISIDTTGDVSNISSLAGNASTFSTTSSVDDHLTSKFDNVQLVGQGEFSNVFEITFQSVKYAVKRIKTPFLGPKRRKRIFEEVELLKTLQENEPKDDEGKEYVINFINDWEQNDHLYIMMELCENGPLDKFLADSGKLSKIDEWRIWKIMVEIAMGLKYIHSCNIMHLDLKPANIFITFEGSLKIGDFGMAAKYPVTEGFEREGDREYIAPEIIHQSRYDKPADIFSFGLIMVEIAANIVLPENGIQWHKLRSGDLSEAGRLSSGDLNMNLFNDSMTSRISTYSSPLNITTITGSSYSSVGDNYKKLPSWTPKFLVDGKCALDKVVQRMINPAPHQRPTAADICNTLEAQFVEVRRKAGAVIYEGEYGPQPDIDEESLMSNEVRCLNLGAVPLVTTIPSDIMDQDEW